MRLVTVGVKLKHLFTYGLRGFAIFPAQVTFHLLGQAIQPNLQVSPKGACGGLHHISKLKNIVF
jgi:hypothetical protein